MLFRVLPFISLNLFNHHVKYVVVSSISRENKGSEEPDPKLLPTVSRTNAHYTCRTCLSFYPERKKKEGLWVCTGGGRMNQGRQGGVVIMCQLRVAGSESSMTCNVCGFTCFHDPFEPQRGPESWPRVLLPVMPSTQQERLSPASFPRSCTSPGPPPRGCCFPTSLQHYPNTPIPSSCRNKGPSHSPITVKPASTAPAGSTDLRVALCVVQSLCSAGLCVYMASKLCRSHLSTLGCCALDHHAT